MKTNLKKAKKQAMKPAMKKGEEPKAGKMPTFPGRVANPRKK